MKLLRRYTRKDRKVEQKKLRNSVDFARLILQGSMPSWRMLGEMPYADVCASRLASVHVFRSVSNTRYRRCNLSTLRVRAQFSSLLASRFPDVSIRASFCYDTQLSTILRGPNCIVRYLKFCSSFPVDVSSIVKPFSTLSLRASGMHVLFGIITRSKYTIHFSHVFQ